MESSESSSSNRQSLPDVKQFQKLIQSKQDAQRCWTLAVDFLKSPQTMETSLTHQVELLAEQQGKSAKSLKKAMRDLILFIRNAAAQNKRPQDVKKDLVQLRGGNILSGVAEEMWTTDLIQVNQSIQGSITHIQELIDIQWQFGITVATEEVKQIGTSFLQVTLAVKDANTNTVTKHFIELSIPQFFDVLTQLEKAKAVMDYLSGTATTSE